MAFRGAAPTDLCSQCRRPSDRGCLRCGRPLCAKHLPPAGNRCHWCEEEFIAHERSIVDPAALETVERKRPLTPILLALTSSSVLALAFLVSTDAFFAVLLGVPMLCFAGFEVARIFAELVHHHREMQIKRERRRFLAERKAHLVLMPRR